jgi:hypothetical protein
MVSILNTIAINQDKTKIVAYPSAIKNDPELSRGTKDFQLALFGISLEQNSPCPEVSDEMVAKRMNLKDARGIRRYRKISSEKNKIITIKSEKKGYYRLGFLYNPNSYVTQNENLKADELLIDAQSIFHSLADTSANKPLKKSTPKPRAKKTAETANNSVNPNAIAQEQPTSEPINSNVVTNQSGTNGLLNLSSPTVSGLATTLLSSPQQHNLDYLEALAQELLTEPTEDQDELLIDFIMLIEETWQQTGKVVELESQWKQSKLKYAWENFLSDRLDEQAKLEVAKQFLLLGSTVNDESAKTLAIQNALKCWKANNTNNVTNDVNQVSGSPKDNNNTYETLANNHILVKVYQNNQNNQNDQIVKNDQIDQTTSEQNLVKVYQNNLANLANSFGKDLPKPKSYPQTRQTPQELHPIILSQLHTQEPTVDLEIFAKLMVKHLNRNQTENHTPGQVVDQTNQTDQTNSLVTESLLNPVTSNKLNNLPALSVFGKDLPKRGLEAQSNLRTTAIPILITGLKIIATNANSGITTNSTKSITTYSPTHTQTQLHAHARGREEKDLKKEEVKVNKVIYNFLTLTFLRSGSGKEHGSGTNTSRDSSTTSTSITDLIDNNSTNNQTQATTTPNPANTTNDINPVNTANNVTNSSNTNNDITSNTANADNEIPQNQRSNKPSSVIDLTTRKSINRSDNNTGNSNDGDVIDSDCENEAVNLARIERRRLDEKISSNDFGLWRIVNGDRKIKQDEDGNYLLPNELNNYPKSKYSFWDILAYAQTQKSLKTPAGFSVGAYYSGSIDVNPTFHKYLEEKQNSLIGAARQPTQPTAAEKALSAKVKQEFQEQLTFNGLKEELWTKLALEEQNTLFAQQMQTLKSSQFFDSHYVNWSKVELQSYALDQIKLRLARAEMHRRETQAPMAS